MDKDPNDSTLILEDYILMFLGLQPLLLRNSSVNNAGGKGLRASHNVEEQQIPSSTKIFLTLPVQSKLFARYEKVVVSHALKPAILSK